MKNLKLVPDPRLKNKQAKGKTEVRFESGSERDSRDNSLSDIQQNEERNMD